MADAVKRTDARFSDPGRVDWACEVMHDAYERAAVGAGWETQEASRKPWADVPQANKETMRVAVSALLDWLDRRPALPLAEIDRQRGLGWPDFHPEDYCHRCGTRNISWSVDSDRFNLAMGPHAQHQWNGIICVACFVELHEAASGLHASWTLTPATPFRPLNTTDPGDSPAGET